MSNGSTRSAAGGTGEPGGAGGVPRTIRSHDSSAGGSGLVIVDYRIEPRDPGGPDDEFRLVVRRRFGLPVVLAVVVLGFFLCIGVSFLYGFGIAGWQALKDAFGGAAPADAAPRRNGLSLCCFPFILGFILLWLRPVMLAFWSVANQLRGREAWQFTNVAVRPAPSIADVEPDAFPLVEPVRAAVLPRGRRWFLGIGTGSATYLTIGEFADANVARRLEDDFRRRRPGWFVEADGTPVVMGVPEEPQSNAAGDPLDPVVSAEIMAAPGGFDLALTRRRKGLRPGTIFFIVWILGWACGEAFVGYKLATHVKGAISGSPPPATAPSSQPAREDPVVFMSIWFTFWSIAGPWAMWMLALRFRSREVWRFRADEVRPGRNWRFPSKRRLPDPGGAGVHARVGPATDMPLRAPRPNIELVAGGLSVFVGPFADEETAYRVARELKARRPRWHWHGGEP